MAKGIALACALGHSTLCRGLVVGRNALALLIAAFLLVS